ncbi:MAG: 5'-nucleotidase C-terminal domain-containing protein [Lewinella sp.]
MSRIIQAGLAALTFSALLSSCQRPAGSPVVQPQFYAITEAIEPDSTNDVAVRVSAIITPYSEQLSEAMNRIVAEVALPLVKAQPESPLGNWTADLLLSAAQDLFPEYDIAFAVQNYGGLRVSEIGAGPLRVYNIYELMPFDNELVLVEVTGRELTEFVLHTLAEGGWPVSDGLSVTQNGEDVVIQVRGQHVAENDTYYIAVPDYVANGGSDAAMLTERRQIGSGRMIRDLLIEYAGKATAPISVKSDGKRVKIID